MHSASLLTELYKMIPPEHLSVRAIGSNHLENAGAKIFFDCKHLGSMGVTEVIKKLSLYINLERDLLFELSIFKPDVVILVDFPGFNLRIAKKVKKLLPETKVVYYLPPQVWAWNQGRTKLLAKYCDLVLCGLPFEEEFHKSRGVNAIYVGNPILNELEKLDREKVRGEFGLLKEDKLIGLFPGSRLSEIKYMLSVLVGAAEKLSRIHPNYKFMIAQAQNIALSSQLSALSSNLKLLPPGNSHKLLCASNIVWLTSGTVTLEAALYETPMILGYRGNYINYFLYLLLRKIDMIGLPNIIAGEKIVSELLQNDATSENYYETTKAWFAIPGHLEKIRHDLKKVREKLGNKNASYEAARIIRNSFMPEYKVVVMK